MTFTNYTNFVPTPAPLTSGSGVQSFTDPTGEVWVAANGVRGGNWYKARDVLVARWWRSAAYNLTTTGISIPYDTAVFDNYGLYNTGTTTFVAPIAGLYEIRLQTLASFTASGQYMIGRIALGPTILAQAQIYASQAGVETVNPMALTQLVPGNSAMAQSYASAALALVTSGQPYNFAEFAYRGTG